MPTQTAHTPIGIPVRYNNQSEPKTSAMRRTLSLPKKETVITANPTEANQVTVTEVQPATTPVAARNKIESKQKRSRIEDEPYSHLDEVVVSVPNERYESRYSAKELRRAWNRRKPIFKGSPRLSAMAPAEQRGRAFTPSR